MKNGGFLHCTNMLIFLIKFTKMSEFGLLKGGKNGLNGTKKTGQSRTNRQIYVVAAQLFCITVSGVWVF